MTKDPLGEAGDVNLYRAVQNNPINFVDPLGLTPGTTAGAWIGTFVAPGPGTIIGAAIGTGIFIVAVAIVEQICKKADDGDCKGIAKNVERHVGGDGLPRHPKPCNDLLICLKRANAAGSIGTPGNQYAVSVYNASCTKDWSSKYPNHTPYFPPF